MYRILVRGISVNYLFCKKFEEQMCKNACQKLSINLINPTKTIFCSAIHFSETDIQNDLNKCRNDNPFDNDEYITPYVERSTRSSKEKLVDILRYNYRVPEKQIFNLLKDQKCGNYEAIKLTLDLLYEKGVYKTNILNNPWLLTNSSKILQAKFELLNRIPIRDINDFIPLLRHSVPRLTKLVNRLAKEQKFFPSTMNRLYYISDRLNLDAITVCNYLSNRLFVLEIPFEMLEESLNHMIKYGVAPLSILKDLWAFRYTPKSVKARLERAKDAKKDKIMPWMVRCPERVLQKSLKLSLDEVKILGEDNTVIDYISERLDIDKNTVGILLRNDSQVLAVRVTKVKEILDYLLDKEGFSKYDVARVPRILCHGLETTRARIEELKSIGCRPTSLVILCRSRREYEKFVNNWLEKQRKIKKQQELL